jgi:hypothetical protein
MIRAIIAFAAVLSASGLPRVVLADQAPTIEQIYSEASAGNLAEAERMIETVLKDHPNSPKAHYFAAQIYSKARKLERASPELAVSANLDPGLSFATPRATQKLNMELAGDGDASPKKSVACPDEKASSALASGGVASGTPYPTSCVSIDGVRVPVLPAVAVVTIRPRDFRDLQERVSPLSGDSRSDIRSVTIHAQSMSGGRVCGVATEKALLLT